MKCQCIFSLGEPSFVNGDGVKWWYVIEPKEHSKLVRGYCVETPDGEREYVLVDHADGEVIYGAHKFEDVAVHQEIINLERRVL